MRAHQLLRGKPLWALETRRVAADKSSEGGAAEEEDAAPAIEDEDDEFRDREDYTTGGDDSGERRGRAGHSSKWPGTWGLLAEQRTIPSWISPTNPGCGAFASPRQAPRRSGRS